MNNYNIIENHLAAKAYLDTATKRYDEIMTPILNDTENITLIYNWFVELSKNAPGFPPVDSNEFRQRFTMIIVLLYTPRALTGEQIIRRKGIRSNMSKVLNVCGTAISNNVSRLSFYYQHERSFQRDINYIYPEILLRIELKGLK